MPVLILFQCIHLVQGEIVTINNDKNENFFITDHDKDVLQIVTFSLQIRKVFSLLITTSL